MIYYSHANKPHFHKEGFAPSRVLEVRVFESRKWPIDLVIFSQTHYPVVKIHPLSLFLEFF